MFKNHAIKYRPGFLHLNLENVSQDFQKALIFEHCKNDNARGDVQWFQFSSVHTLRIDCITKTMPKFTFIKMTKLRSETRKEFYTEWIINTK